MILKVFTDYACPFCYIGYKLAEKVVKELDIEVEYYFSEIHPEVPEEGCVTSDIVKGELSKFNDHIARLAASYGIKPQIGDRISNSKKAIILRGFINEKYPELLKKFDEAIYKAYLVDNLDIGDKKVLSCIMNTVGVTENIDIALANTMANIKFELDRSVSKENYVDSIPTFVIDGRRLVGAVSSIELTDFIQKV